MSAENCYVIFFFLFNNCCVESRVCGKSIALRIKKPIANVYMLFKQNTEMLFFKENILPEKLKNFSGYFDPC